MKSKTSCFNTTIFRKNFAHFWPIWVIYLCYLLLVLPVNIWLSASASRYNDSLMQLSKPYLVIGGALRQSISPFPVFLASVAMALAVFSYLYSARNANMMHSFPVNRFELYVTNYLSGLVFLILPEVIAFVTAVLVCLSSQIICIQYLFVWLVYLVGVTFFAYSFAVLVAMFTGQVFAMPVYYFILNYLYVGCLYIVNLLIGLISYGISGSWNPGATCILSPLYYINNNIRVKEIYEDGVVTGISVRGGNLVAIYALAGLVIMVTAYQLYKRRRIETAGDLISIGFVKPVFRWGVALCGGALLSVLLTGLLSEVRKVNTFLCIAAGIVICGFLCFFIAEMMLQKSFRVFRKKRILEWVGFTVAAVFILTLFKLDVFGIEQYIPKESEIKKAFIFLDYPIQLTDEDLSELLSVHEQIIASKKEYLAVTSKEKVSNYVTFRYFLKNGRLVERRYPLPISEEYINDETKPTGKIISWEKSPEILKSRILGINYESNDYYTGFVDLYSDGGESNSHVLNEEQLEELIAAIEEDIDEGNYNSSYLGSISDVDSITYFNGISLSYYNKNPSYDIWDYYNNYSYSGSYPQTSFGTELDSGSAYISFGPDCIHTIDALNRLGITDDTWKLCTYEEFEQNLNK